MDISRRIAHVALAAAVTAVCACGRSEPDTFFRVDHGGASTPSSPAADTPYVVVDPMVVSPPAEVAAPEVAATDVGTSAEADTSIVAAEVDRPPPATHETPRTTVTRRVARAVRPSPEPATPARRADEREPVDQSPATPADAIAVRDAPEPARTRGGGGLGDARSLNREAIALINGGRPEAAIAKLERALDLQPRDAEILGNLGYAYMLAGEHRRAASRFMTALDIAPTRSATWLNLGQTCAEMGQRDVAVDAVLKGYRYSTRKRSVRAALQRAANSERFDAGWREAAGLALTRIDGSRS